jgi:hypothetical protein
VFFRKHKKYPLYGGKVPFAFVKNVAIIFPSHRQHFREKVPGTLDLLMLPTPLPTLKMLQKL